jgi:hypothetical protein
VSLVFAPVLVACGGTDQDVAEGAAPDAGQYPYSAAGFEQCLTDSDVQFRKGDDGSLTVVNSTDAAVSAEADRCSALTTRAATDESTAWVNTITLGIADCLNERGYHVSTSGDDSDLTDGGGRDIATYNVPEAERAAAAFATDEQECMKAAEAAHPSPAP